MINLHTLRLSLHCAESVLEAQHFPALYVQAVKKWLIVLRRKHGEWGIGQPLPVHEEAFGRQRAAFQTVCGSDLDDLLYTKVFSTNSILISIFKGFQYLLIILPPTFAQ
jgi:hypothetical protein